MKPRDKDGSGRKEPNVAERSDEMRNGSTPSKLRHEVTRNPPNQKPGGCDQS